MRQITPCQVNVIIYVKHKHLLIWHIFLVTSFEKSIDEEHGYGIFSEIRSRYIYNLSIKMTPISCGWQRNKICMLFLYVVFVFNDDL